MCQNLNDIYFKLAVGTIIATIIGIIAGIGWPSFLTNFPTLLIIQLVTAAVVLIILGVYLLVRQTRNNQNYSYLRYYIRFLLFGTFGSFIISITALSTALTAGLSGAVIIGVAVGFFSLLIISLIFLFDFLIKSNAT